MRGRGGIEEVRVQDLDQTIYSVTGPTLTIPDVASDFDAYERDRAEGRSRSLLDVLIQEPIRFIVYLAIVATILYFSIKPFFQLGR